MRVRLLVIVAGVYLSLATAPRALAAPITWEFSGVVTAVDGFSTTSLSQGDLFCGTLSYDYDESVAFSQTVGGPMVYATLSVDFGSGKTVSADWAYRSGWFYWGHPETSSALGPGVYEDFYLLYAGTTDVLGLPFADTLVPTSVYLGAEAWVAGAVTEYARVPEPGLLSLFAAGVVCGLVRLRLRQR